MKLKGLIPWDASGCCDESLLQISGLKQLVLQKCPTQLLLRKTQQLCPSAHKESLETET